MTLQVIKTVEAVHLVFDPYETTEQVYSLTPGAFDLFLPPGPVGPDQPTGADAPDAGPDEGSESAPGKGPDDELSDFLKGLE